MAFGRDARDPTNIRRALNDWPSLEGLTAEFDIDRQAAQERLKSLPVWLNFKVTGDEITTAYEEPPVQLPEIGASNGQVLVTGTWTQREPKVLSGHAYMSAPQCQLISYDIRSMLDAHGGVVTLGPTPILKVNSAVVAQYAWSDSSIMQFIIPPVDAKVREKRKRKQGESSKELKIKPKPKTEAKPKPSARHTTPAPQYQRYQNTQYQYPQ